MPPRRAYRSPLRDAQQDLTRARILEAVVQAAAEDPEHMAVARIAALAGVSEPTVFRHYPTKADMIAAVRADIRSRLDDGLPEPTTEAEAFAMLREFFRRYEALGPARHSLMFSAAEEAKRVERAPERFAFVERVFGARLDGLRGADRVAARDVVALLLSSGALRAFKTYLGLSAETVADRVEWAVGTLLRGAGALPEPATPEAPPGKPRRRT